MSRTTLWESLRIFRKEPEEEVMELLRTCPVFAGIPDRGLRQIREMCHLRYYKDNEHIFRYGEPGVGLYIVLEGQVEIYRLEAGDYHRQFTVLGPGDFLGELALLEDLPRTASAASRGYSRVMGFFRPDLLSLLQRNPRLGSLIILNMARLTARRLINTNDELEKLQQEVSSLPDGAIYDAGLPD
ncbi:MAG: cyclic nucleotide-binding domain-containing protein [bacterium]|nr:cyclic nucleotide-binding domain-containing protein [bacterium]